MGDEEAVSRFEQEGEGGGTQPGHITKEHMYYSRISRSRFLLHRIIRRMEARTIGKLVPPRAPARNGVSAANRVTIFQA